MTDTSEAPAAARRERRDNKDIASSPNFDLLAGVSLRVSVEFDHAAFGQREQFGEGHRCRSDLDRAATDLLDIYANGTLIAKGEIVSVDGRYGIQVAEVVAPDRGLGGLDRRK